MSHIDMAHYAGNHQMGRFEPKWDLSRTARPALLCRTVLRPFLDLYSDAQVLLEHSKLPVPSSCLSIVPQYCPPGESVMCLLGRQGTCVYISLAICRGLDKWLASEQVREVLAEG